MTYYFSCSSIRALINYCSQNKHISCVIDNVATQENNNLLNEEFCNCMRHYEILDDNLLNMNIRQNNELDALISFYHGSTKADFVNKLNEHLKSISEQIANNVLVTRDVKGNVL